MKYYIVMEDKELKAKGRSYYKQYKRYKCVDGFTTYKNVCWKFSKQGALKIIERLKYERRQNINNYEFYLEEAE